jgi:hypothetical protein
MQTANVYRVIRKVAVRGVQENEIKRECPSSYGFIELTTQRSKVNPFLRREAGIPRKWLPVNPALSRDT